MMKTFIDVLDVKNRVESGYLAMEGVHGASIGWDGETEQFCICLHVLPETCFGVDFSLEIEGVKLMIIREAQPESFVDDKKYRPLKGGIQLGLDDDNCCSYSCGTLGCMAVDNKNSKVVALTNQHVIRDEGTKIGQPRNCCCDGIGATVRSVLSSKVDGAICSIGNVSCQAEILEIGQVTGIYTVTPDDIKNGGYPVRKRGRTTGLTSGKITKLNYSGTRTDGWEFKDQLYISSKIGDSGDSGSAVVNGRGEVVGLYWGGSKSNGVASPIENVMNELNIRILTANDMHDVVLEEQKVIDRTSLLDNLEKGLSRYPWFSFLYNQVTLHWSEVRRLINSDKRVATVWIRQQGASWVDRLSACVQQPDVPLKCLISEENDGIERVKALAGVLQEQGSGELKEAIQECLPLIVELLEKSYGGIMEEPDSLIVPNSSVDSGTANSESSIQATLEESSLNYLLQKYFQANKDYFDLEKEVSFTFLGKEYTYNVKLQATEAPVLAFAPLASKLVMASLLNNLGVSREERERLMEMHSGETSSDNLKLSLKNAKLAIESKNQGDEGIPSLMVGIEVLGTIGVADSDLQIMALDGKITADSQVDPIATLLLQLVLDLVKGRFTNYPLPQLASLLGFMVTLDRAEIADKKLNVYLGVTKDKRLISGGDTVSLLPFILGDNKASIEMKVPEWTLNYVVANSIHFPEFSKKAESSSHGWGAHTGIFAGVETPSVIIDHRMATATAHLGAKAYVGIQAFGKWFNITLTPGIITLKLSVQLKTINSGKTVVLKFIPNFDTLTIDWGLKLPFPFSIATSCVQGLLAQLVVWLVEALKREFGGIEIPVFTLEESYEVLNMNMNVVFDAFGFNEKQVSVKVSAR